MYSRHRAIEVLMPTIIISCWMFLLFFWYHLFDNTLRMALRRITANLTVIIINTKKKSSFYIISYWKHFPALTSRIAKIRLHLSAPETWRDVLRRKRPSTSMWRSSRTIASAWTNWWSWLALAVRTPFKSAIHQSNFLPTEPLKVGVGFIAFIFAQLFIGSAKTKCSCTADQATTAAMASCVPATWRCLATNRRSSIPRMRRGSCLEICCTNANEWVWRYWRRLRHLAKCRINLTWWSMRCSASASGLRFARNSATSWMCCRKPLYTLLGIM